MRRARRPPFLNVVEQQKNHPRAEQEEDVLRERVRGVGIAERIDDRGHHQQHERPPDRVPGIESGPDRVDHVRDQQPEKDLRVRERHAKPRPETVRRV